MLVEISIINVSNMANKTSTIIFLYYVSIYFEIKHRLEENIESKPVSSVTSFNSYEDSAPWANQWSPPDPIEKINN